GARSAARGARDGGRPGALASRGRAPTRQGRDVSEEGGASATACAGRKTIAIVEDNPDNLLLIHAILEDHYAIAAYENGPDALAGMHDTPPQLVLLAISLPGIAGLEVLKHLREDATLRPP